MHWSYTLLTVLFCTFTENEDFHHLSRRLIKKDKKRKIALEHQEQDVISYKFLIQLHQLYSKFPVTSDKTKEHLNKICSASCQDDLRHTDLQKEIHRVLKAAAGANFESISESYALLFLNRSATHDLERHNVRPFLQQLSLKWHHIEILIFKADGGFPTQT